VIFGKNMTDINIHF